MSREQSTAGVSYGKGLLILVGLIAAISVFLLIGWAFGASELWCGFLLILHWSSNEHMKTSRLAHCVGGALLGLTLGYALQVLPAWISGTGIYLFLAILLFVIYCQIVSWFPLAVNTSTMLFLTVSTISWIQTRANFLDMYIGLALGAGFLGAIIVIANVLQRRRANAT